MPLPRPPHPLLRSIFELQRRPATSVSIIVSSPSQDAMPGAEACLGRPKQPFPPILQGLSFSKSLCHWEATQASFTIDILRRPMGPRAQQKLRAEPWALALENTCILGYQLSSGLQPSGSRHASIDEPRLSKPAKHPAHFAAALSCPPPLLYTSFKGLQPPSPVPPHPIQQSGRQNRRPAAGTRSPASSSDLKRLHKSTKEPRITPKQPFLPAKINLKHLQSHLPHVF